MDHVGIRGYYQLAAFLNVASEQFADLGCEFANDFKGAVYGYAGDAYNMLQWERPVAVASINLVSGSTYHVTTAVDHNLSNGNTIIVKNQSPRSASNDPFDTSVYVVGGTVTSREFDIVVPGTLVLSFTGGNLYKRLFSGAIQTPDLTPYAQNSFKQQLHQQGNYRAFYGIAGILDGADSQHIYRSCHPVCGFYPADTALADATLTKGANTYLSGISGGTFAVGNLVSFTAAGTSAGKYLDTRLFKLATPATGYTFELVDVYGQPIDSSGWSVGGSSTTVHTMARQKVAGGDDPFAGGFGMRLVVSTQAGCDLSEYGLHHEPGPTGGTTWWASVDRFESLLDPMVAPGPVLLTDVSFKEAAAHGRCGFLLAQSSGVSSLTMLGGAITLAHPQAAMGSTGHADKLLMASGSGASPWVLANTDLVVEEAALVEAGKLAGARGRLTAKHAGSQRHRPRGSSNARRRHAGSRDATSRTTALGRAKRCASAATG